MLPFLISLGSQKYECSHHLEFVVSFSSQIQPRISFQASNCGVTVIVRYMWGLQIIVTEPMSALLSLVLPNTGWEVGLEQIEVWIPCETMGLLFSSSHKTLPLLSWLLNVYIQAVVEMELMFCSILLFLTRIQLCTNFQIKRF